MPDYTKGKIYRIDIGDHFYIGSTTLSLNQRFANHKQDIHRPSRLYTTMRTQPTADISLIESYSCGSRAELTARETYHILQHRDNPNCLNMRVGHRTAEEIATYRKSYREKKIMCECGTHITAGNIATHRKTRIHRQCLQFVQGLQLQPQTAPQPT